MENKLQRLEPECQAVALTSDSQVDILIATITPAIRGGTDPAVVREQIALMKDLMAMKAKESFDAAMARFRANCPPVLKTKAVENMYRYAPLDSVVLQVREALEKEGFGWSFDMDQAPSGQVTGVCVASGFGHTERRAVTLPIAGGNRASNATKDAAGALSFAQRRAFQNAFGIVVQGEDTDAHQFAKAKGPGTPPDAAPQGQGAAGSPPDEAALRQKLWDMMEPVHRGVRSWTPVTTWLHTNKIIPADMAASKIPSDMLPRVIEMTEVQIRVEKGLL